MATILVVDDDNGVRQTLEDALSDAGFEVVSAADTITACEQLERYPAVDLCLVDLVMPGPDGAAFARLAKERTPDRPVILMTGYYAAGAKASDLAESIIYKPVDIDKLVAEINRQLARRGGASASPPVPHA